MDTTIVEEGGGIAYAGQGRSIWNLPLEFEDEFDINERPPQWQEGEYTVTRLNGRTAPGCHDNCGLLAYVKDGKLERIEGDPLNPYNLGAVCPRCWALDETVYSSLRVNHPMVRDPQERGNKDAWKRVSWNEAYDLIEENWKAMIEESGGECIQFMLGTGRDYCGYTHRLSEAVGSPNNGFGFLSGTACYLPRLVSLTSTIGDYVVADVSQYKEKRWDDPEFKNPEVIINWGCNAIVSNPDGFLGHWIVESYRRGSKMITIDPTLTWLAAKSEVWLPIRPGTDSALALGIGHVMVKEDLVDHDFIDKWVYGYDQYSERVEEWTPEKTAEICGVDADDIVKAARMYANAENAAIQWGLAIDQQHYGFQAGLGIVALWAITGNVDNPGGNIIARPPWGLTMMWMGGWGEWDGVSPNHPDTENILPPEQAEKIIDGGFPLPHIMQMNVPDAFPEAAINGKPYKIRSFFLIATNPLSCMGADPHLCEDAMLAAEFNIACDYVVTPTIQSSCDVILPVTTFIERYGVGGFSTTYAGAMKPAIQPTGEQKSDIHMEVELGRRFLPEAFPDKWKGDKEIADHWLRHTGLTYDELAERTWIRPKFEYYKYEKGMLRMDGKPGFNTSTGRIEIWSTTMAAIDEDPLPAYGEPPESPISNPALFRQYPIILTTGKRPWTLFHSEHRQCPSLRAVKPDATFRIHPKLAAQYGIKTGDLCKIENQYGYFTQIADITLGIREDTISCDHGWWYPEREYSDGSELNGTFEHNPNCCIPLRPGPVGYGASYKSTLCKITKLTGTGPEIADMFADSVISNY